MQTKEIKLITKKDLFRIITAHYKTGLVKSVILLEDSLTKTPRQDRYILEKIVKSIKPKIILEIGTYLGQMTLELAKNSPGSQIYTIDICKEMDLDVPDYQKDEVLPKVRVGERFRNKAKNICQILGDSRKFSTYSFLGGKKIDFAFIDGNHSLEAVIQDTQNLLKFTQRNSIIFWHDFLGPGKNEVKEALSYLVAKKQLEIFQIDKTHLAYSIL